MQATTRNSLSLDELFATTVERVYSFLVVRCGNTMTAEELTAETFAAASARFAEGRGSEVTLPWLITVARRRLVDHWRREQTHHRRIAGLIEQFDLSPEQVLRDTTVADVLADLPQKYRAALTLRYLDGFAVNEVAEALAMSYKATESLLSRARASFATAYKEHR